ncbi:MAG: cytidine deaminase [Roseivirga sp.]|nr:cytidine deaminase [Roseivirga sp.]
MTETISSESRLKVYPSMDELPQEEQALIQAAQASALRAYAKYSQFQVGAALRLEDGKIITGNNQENACYPAGLCAERVAFFAAKSQYPELAIKAVAVVAKRAEDEIFRAASPCGSCRQVMSEYENNQEDPIQLYMMDAEGKIYESASIENLLPFKFSEASLGNT